jgi:hypothetical protein
MIFATLIMGAVCFAVKNSPLYPHGAGRIIWAVQLVMLLTLGAGIYLGLCAAFGITLIKEMLPRRR